MKVLLFSVSFFAASLSSAATSSGMTWNENLVAQLKTQTAFAAFCKKPKGVFTKEACVNSAKDAGFKNFKFKNVELVSPAVVRVGDGPRSVEISFGEKYGQFALNGRTIDFAAMNSKEIADKISAALPKVGAASLFMNSAHAATDTFIYLKRAVHAMLAAKSDEEVCENAQKVVDICSGTATMTGTDGLIKAQDKFSKLLQNASHSPEQLNEAAAEVEEEAERANTFLDLSAGLFLNAYGRSPDNCEVKVREEDKEKGSLTEKKTKASGVLSECKDKFAKKQDENNKAVAALNLKLDNTKATELVARATESLNNINFSMTKQSAPEFTSARKSKLKKPEGQN